VNPIVFLVLAALLVVAAITVVLHRNPVHSALALVAAMCLLSVFFIALDAQMVGFLQVIVYAGAVVVLFLFVIMLLNLQRETRALGGGALVVAGAAAALAFLALMVPGLVRVPAAGPVEVASGYGETIALAERLFTVYLLPFELTSVLLLVAIVGAVALAKRTV
jgi:NADH-quinone oxidoreductase subunit J